MNRKRRMARRRGVLWEGASSARGAGASQGDTGWPPPDLRLKHERNSRKRLVSWESEVRKGSGGVPMPTPSIRARRIPPMAALWKEARIPARKNGNNNNNKKTRRERRVRS